MPMRGEACECRVSGLGDQHIIAGLQHAGGNGGHGDPASGHRYDLIMIQRYTVFLLQQAGGSILEFTDRVRACWPERQIGIAVQPLHQFRRQRETSRTDGKVGYFIPTSVQFFLYYRKRISRCQG